jgi:hypothetical protein
VNVAEREVRAGAVCLPLPPGWEDRTVLTIAGPAVSGVSPNVIVTRETLCDNMGLGGFASGWLDRLADELPVRERRPVEHTHVAGQRAQVRCVEWAAAGTAVVQLVALFCAGGSGYAAVCTAPTDAFEAMEPGFRELLAGLRVEPVGDQP